jgi:RNA polymerase sigma factor (sigma-70 family)
MPPMADERETVAVAAGPDTRFATGVFLRYQHSLLRYLRDLLVRREDAEDVAQETFLRLVRAEGLEPSEARVRAFMFKVATNLAYDRFRQRRAHGRQDDTELVALPDEAPPAERVVALEQGVAIVERTLLRLPVRCRQVFLLRVSHEWSYEAIAAHLGVGKRTVEREMQQALQACAQNLEKGHLR